MMPSALAEHLVLMSPNKAASSNRTNLPNLKMLSHARQEADQLWRAHSDDRIGAVHISHQQLEWDRNQRILKAQPVGKVCCCVCVGPRVLVVVSV